MIMSVAEGMAIPAPRPNSSRPIPVGRYDATVDERGLHGDSGGGEQRAGGDGHPSAVHRGEVSAGAGADQHADCGGDEGEAGRERCVVEDELQVLGLQEDGAGHGEEQHGQGDAGGGEAAVAEQRTCRASGRRVASPSHEHDRDRRADREVDERGGQSSRARVPG